MLLFVVSNKKCMSALPRKCTVGVFISEQTDKPSRAIQTLKERRSNTDQLQGSVIRDGVKIFRHYSHCRIQYHTKLLGQRCEIKQPVLPRAEWDYQMMNCHLMKWSLNQIHLNRTFLLENNQNKY